MFKKLTLGLCLLTLSTSSFAQEVSLNEKLYTDQGCAPSYYKKAKATNRLMGATIGGASIAASSILPFGWIFVLGGMGAIGESAYDLGHEKFDQFFQENFKVKSVIETKPPVRYPLARQYFDTLNTLEFAKALKDNASDIAEYLKIYIRSSALASKLKPQYKECKSKARLVGISKPELKNVEKNLLEYLMQMESNEAGLNEIDKGKQEFANCLLELKMNEEDDVYPLADMLLAQHELKDTGLLSWRLKGVVRQYVYIYNLAQEENKDINIDQYFPIVSRLDQEKGLCKSGKRPLNRKKMAKEVIGLIK